MLRRTVDSPVQSRLSPFSLLMDEGSFKLCVVLRTRRYQRTLCGGRWR